MTTAVYERAGFPSPARDVLPEGTDYLAEARMDAIRERTGQALADEWAVLKDPARVLARSGFDRTMKRSLLSTGHPTDLVLFLAHAYAIFEEDGSSLRKASLAGSYNRALLAMKEDIEAIDGAVAAVTGRGKGRA